MVASTKEGRCLRRATTRCIADGSRPHEASDHPNGGRTGRRNSSAEFRVLLARKKAALLSKPPGRRQRTRALDQWWPGDRFRAESGGAQERVAAGSRERWAGVRPGLRAGEFFSG